MATGSVVARFLLGLELFGSHRFQLFLGAVTAIRVALLQEGLENFSVPIHTAGLVERTFVSREPQPLHAIEDDLRGGFSGPFTVGIFNAENELSRMPTRIQP